ncbi:MAG: Outer membrane TonB-dependent transporter, utilization system for glycans and polysaccharides (PUL), SusC family [uncultured Cytophagales bacterium]|uniref:Outer membrane TonB-dependent transporter, utilization system for glycans and polysaccharides (PUL), SusC family n=1 Tax=uncultured Cytophagales bacterium TaxID=158755 RepID=A0A6J4KNK6_9SPHI|nr:MAG: Outer membrane TonB-dependent transporter, utilization system for glycans and polysaccharides (PUL), SusC family [uncultured Cytophagales bacterium]
MHIHLLHNLRAGRRLGAFLVAALVWMAALPAAWAQSRTVTGTVTAQEDNSPLPGVTVLVKGTTNGTATGADGGFSIAVPDNNAVLVFSFIGFQSQEIPVGSQATINAKLASDVQALSEVVVIGYGEQQKKDVTGGVVALTPKEFNKGVIASPEQLLQGRAAGVQITPASGEPGAAVNIRIRGTTSIRGGNNPLFVVDGVPLDGGNNERGTDYGAGEQSPRNPLTFLNPADIENITVLKDASAAAIYGARGANGVVLITTRRGKAGTQSLNFAVSSSISSPLKRYDLLSASEFIPALQAAGGDPNAPGVNGGASTDWQDEVLRTSLTQNYSVDFGGGNEDTRYFFSLGYNDQQGIIRRSGLKRLAGRVNATHELFNDKVVLELNLATSGVQDQYAPVGDNAGFRGNLIGAALQANPTFPIRNPDGTYYTPGGDFRNPVATMNLIDDNGNTNRTLGRISATWRIIKGLSYKLNFALDNATSVRRVSIPRGLPGFNDDITVGPNNPRTGTGLNVANGLANITNQFATSRLLEHTLNYSGKLGIGTLDGLLGFAYQRFENRNNYTLASNFLADVVRSGLPLYDVIGGVNNKDNRSYYSGAARGQNELQSYFGRLQYNINERYIFTGTLRVDGSSKFGPNNKYGYFPALAFGWQLSEEGFIPEAFSQLKLRLNWGLTGNQEYPGNTSRVIFSFDPNNAAVTPLNNPNADIRWEQTQQYGAGIDFGLMEGRFTGTLDYFKKGTKDLIFQAVQSQPTATQFVWVNLPGNVNNEGAELTLGYDIIQNDAFNWNTSFNATYVTTKVTGIGTIINTGDINGQGLSGAYAQQIRDGYPVGAFFLREFGGYEEDGTGVYPNNEELTYAGNAIPKFNFGLSNSFTYGNWDLNLFLTAATNFYVYNNTANAIFVKGNLRNGRNVTRDVVDSQESANNFAEASTRFLERGDFLRLSNFTLGHNFKLPEGIYLKNARLYVTGQNVFLISKYSGVDPEINTNKARDNVPSIGIDYTAFPSARTFTIGLSAGF